MQGITLNPVTIRKFNYNNSNVSKEVKNDQNNKYTASGAMILANQNIAFMSKKPLAKDDNGIPKYDKKLVADEAEGHYSYYLRNNPEEFYVRNGFQINNFLRNGVLDPILETEEDVPDIFKEIVAQDVSEKKDYNRAIVDSVEILDSMMLDKTTEPMIVYRYAPTSWLDTAEDGIIKDDGFFSTTMVKGGTLEGYVDPNNKTCFEVWVPEGTPYIDLTDKGEYEMLFPRGLEFSVLDNKSLEMLSKE